MTEDVSRHARTLWGYLVVGRAPERSDVVVALGSNSTRVAARAAEIFLAGYGRFLVLSGGNGAASALPGPEALAYRDIARAMGVPDERIIVEPDSSNLGENVAFTRRRLAALAVPASSVLAVHKPYLERRTLATFARLWPEADCRITSPAIPFERYASTDASREELVNLLVGTLDRIRDYPALGFQVPQEIPGEVAAAREALGLLGYRGYGERARA